MLTEKENIKSKEASQFRRFKMYKQRPSSPPSKLFHEVVERSWWVIVVCLTQLFLFDRSYTNKQEELKHLDERKNFLNLAISDLEEEKKRLLFRMNSEKERSWLALLLKEKLGVSSPNEKRIPTSPATSCLQ